MAGSDHELALEEALQRIGGDGNESDDDNMSVVSGYEGPDEEEQSYNSTASTHRVFRTTGHHQTAAPTSISLKQILDDDRSFMLFRRFLKDQCISRNLQFWLACEYYQKQSDKSKTLELAKAIYVKFLKSSAPLHVSTTDSSRRKIQMAVQLKTELDSCLFVEAQNQIYQQMEANELRQFLCSDAFSECSQFNGMFPMSRGSMGTELGFQPSRYRTGGSLHSSDDSTSITSFTSDDIGSSHTTQVLCMPPHTRIAYTPRNAHSDTEHSSRYHHHRGHSSTAMTTHYSRSKVLTQNEFYEILYERLSAIQRDRANMKQHARNIAREEGKSYEEIMSMEWFDAPEAIKYVQFDDEGNADQINKDEQSLSALLATTSIENNRTVSPMELPQPNLSNGSNSHIMSIAAKEIQEAVKDLDITRQVRQKRTSSAMSSSASSYISDSGVDGFINSSGGSTARIPNRVQAYLQNQQRYTSQLSERDAQAHVAATMLINNSVPHEELNPLRRRQFSNYPGTYSSDDSSSCFTATSQSSNSEFFVPRRANHHMYNNSGDTTEESRHHHQRYPPGMRKLTGGRRLPAASSSRYPLATNTQQSSTTTTTSVSASTTNGQSLPATTVHSSSDSLLVAYTIEGFTNTLAKRVAVSSLTLADFKEKVFNRRGRFRFFFKSYCDELKDVILEEITEDSQTLPLYEGKIVGHVEKINDL